MRPRPAIADGVRRDPAPTPTATTAPERRLRVPITWVLQISTALLLAAAVASVLAISLTEGRRAARLLLQERAGRTIEAVVGRLLGGYVDPLVRGLDGIGAAIEAGALDPGDAEAMGRFVAGAEATTPQLGELAFIRPDLRADVYADRGAPRRDQDYDLPEIREMLDWARSAHGLRWNPPQWSPMLEQPILSAVRPVHRDGRLLGVLRTARPLGSLAQTLAGLTPTDDERAFILYGDDMVVACAGATAATRPSADHPLPRLDESGNPVLARLWTPAADTIALPDPNLSARILHLPAGDYTVVYQSRDAGTDKRWIVGTYARGNLAAAEMRRVERMGAAGAAILALAVAVVFGVGRGLSRPVVGLARAAATIERQDLDGFRPLARSRIREVDQAARAFNGMVDGLKERERIRDLFGRYVPRDVARSLLAGPQALMLGGAKCQITMLFSDVADFTTMSEQLPPDHILGLLNQYFDEIYTRINDQGGIIVDFMGDGMFAIFGAPVAQADHAARAVAAARAIAAFADGFARDCRARGVPFGATRIGLHTGVATVGNLGSLNRVKYSAVGDVVNTASRLEGANKLFGTGLLASAETVRQAGTAECRPLGALVLKGRITPLPVFEIAVAAMPDHWVDYRTAFARLEAGDADAAAAFRALATVAPDDGVVRAHLDRLEAGVVSTVIELTQK